MPTPKQAWLAALAALALTSPASQARIGADELERLLSLSLEELGQQPVTSASLAGASLLETPASVFVIHRDELRAAGARSLAEALRLAPNLHVARIEARGHAISARGLKTSISNKLLVLVDGRPIYTPLFSGVLWDQQDILLEDIERIEVISGPGAAVWGTNAVNGVINVITRPSDRTTGTMASAFAGGDSFGAAARQGWSFGGDGSARVYAKHVDFQSTEAADGSAVGDGWKQSQAGFRSDWTGGGDVFRLQGAAYRAESAPRPVGPIRVQGHHLLGFWARELPGGGSLDARAFYDVVDREDPLILLDRMRLLDLELRHTIQGDVHTLVWGGGYRHGDDDSSPGAAARLDPAERTLEWISLFVEDSIALSPRLLLDLGLRAESNTYTDVELLPSARVSWRLGDDAVLWASASRAVRAPARFDRDLFVPTQEPFFIRGGPEFMSETVDVAELGVRVQPSTMFGFSVTAFHHWFDRLRAGHPAAAGGVEISNGVEGRVYGIEAWATARMAAAWELAFGLLELRKSLQLKPGFPGGTSLRDQGNDPEHQYMLRLTRALPRDQQLFLHLRHVSSLPDPYVPAYTSLDARWSWQPTERLEMGLGVDNLLDDRHAEFAPNGGSPQSWFGRSLAVDLRVDFP